MVLLLILIANRYKRCYSEKVIYQIPDIPGMSPKYPFLKYIKKAGDAFE